MQQDSWPAALRRISCALLWFAAMTGIHPLSAQDTCSRCLNGFRFMPSSVIGDPFGATSFTNATGGGMALDLQVPVRDADGNVTDSAGGDIGFLLLDFEYQRSILKWLAVRGAVSALGRVGTSTEAIVAGGASVQFGGSIGATFPIWRNDKFAVAGVTDFRRRNQYVVDPYAFARLIADSGFGPGAKEALLRDEKVTHWSAGARVAWAPLTWLGLNASVEPGRIDSPTLGDRSLTGMGIQAAVDFDHLWNFPLGTSIGWQQRTGPGRRGEFAGSYRSWELGLFYTGASSFTIGTDFFWQRLAVDRAVLPDLKAVQFRLVTRLDF